MKQLFLVPALCLLSACAFNKNDDISESNKNQLRQNALIDNTYRPLVGVYDGTITTSRGVQEAQLSIRVVNVDITNPDGTPGIKRVPYAYLKRITPIVDDMTYSPRFQKEDGALVLIAQANNVGLDGIQTMDLYFKQDALTGVALNPNKQIVGNASFTKSSSQAQVPDDSFEQDRRERLLRIYEKVAGVYTGKIERVNPKDNPFPVRLTINIFDSAVEMPKLVAHYEPLKYAGAGMNLSMDVQYNLDVSPPTISMSGNGGGTYVITLTGNVIGDEIIGQAKSVHEGLLGKLKLKKQSK